MNTYSYCDYIFEWKNHKFYEVDALKLASFFKKSFLIFVMHHLTIEISWKCFSDKNFYISPNCCFCQVAHINLSKVSTIRMFMNWYIYTLYTVWGLNVHSIYKVCITFQRENYWMFSTRQPVTGSLKVLNVNTMIRIQKL